MLHGVSSTRGAAGNSGGLWRSSLHPLTTVRSLGYARARGDGRWRVFCRVCLLLCLMQLRCVSFCVFVRVCAKSVVTR